MNVGTVLLVRVCICRLYCMEHVCAYNNRHSQSTVQVQYIEVVDFAIKNRKTVQINLRDHSCSLFELRGTYEYSTSAHLQGVCTITTSTS